MKLVLQREVIPPSFLLSSPHKFLFDFHQNEVGSFNFQLPPRSQHGEAQGRDRRGGDDFEWQWRGEEWLKKLRYACELQESSFDLNYKHVQVCPAVAEGGCDQVHSVLRDGGKMWQKNDLISPFSSAGRHPGMPLPSGRLFASD